MNTIDAVNSLYIIGSSGYSVYNVYILYKAKQSKGLSLGSQIFFLFWTFWSLLFYGSLHQWWSIGGELVLSISTLVYVALMFVYRLRRRKC